MTTSTSTATGWARIAITATSERGGANSAVARWRGGWCCDVQAGDYSVVVDEPAGAGGTALGPMPTDLLLASVASCYALALAWAARKRGFELPDLEVTATGTYEGPRFAAFVVTVSTTLDVDRLTPLLEPARRVCYVSNTLAQTPSITVSLAPPTS
jgi:putative redox protein